MLGGFRRKCLVIEFNSLEKNFLNFRNQRTLKHKTPTHVVKTVYTNNIYRTEKMVSFFEYLFTSYCSEFTSAVLKYSCTPSPLHVTQTVPTLEARS